ncbi:hypothetical protein BKA82DRAFT_4350584 [Pisolithus tinctorius]|nr:hypothetical protein BKA82DRAFT_4350584 [Pisolithus tinctorius]
MARTRQNAKKTTSGTAPRVQIIRAARATPIRRASSPLAEEWRNRYCYLCHNGAKYLFECYSCPRVVCDPCLGLAQWLTDKARAEDIDFQCPSCHELEEGGAKLQRATFVLLLGKRIPMLDKPVIISGICERASKSQVCAESTLILELVCTGVEIQGSLPSLLNTTIEEYHTSDSLLYQKVIFDFGTDRKFSRWSMRIKKLGEKLGAYAFKRKIIFITVHSEVTRGDLFAGKGESGEDVAMEVGEFMKCLFTSPLQNMVYCGVEAIYRAPEYTVAFTAKNFLNAVVKIFIVSYGVKVLIEGHALENVIHDLLDVSLELRMHTDVMLFHLSGLGLPRAPWLLSPAPLTAAPLLAIYRYSWYHSHRRPWGTSLSMGCLNCGAIRPWARSKLDPHPPSGYHLKTRVSTCRKCAFEVHTQPLPVEYDVLHGDPTSGWLKYTICAAVPL